MPGLFSRIKTWVSTEDVVYSDLNAEFDNVLTNFVPLMMDDYSTNVAQMQVKTDPGEVGTESLATTLAGEIARLRHLISEITGETQWYTSPSNSLAGLAGAIGTGLADNRLVSGRVRSTSEQPMHLVAHGAARTVTLKGASTNFLYYIEGTQYTIDADVTLTNLTLAPSSNNTCLVNDANASDQYWTKYSGEDGTEITIDTVGSEITALVGKIAAFKLDNGSTAEYFIARVETDKLTRANRGYFFDPSDNPIPRIVYSNNDTITLMKLGWVFAKTDETLTVVYTNPTWSGSEPTSPSNGDYWYDLENEKWKKYDVSSFVDADATLVGVCIQDTTNCVAARSFEYFKAFEDTNTIELVYSTAAIATARYKGGTLNVWGETFKFDHDIPAWGMTTNLESGVTEAASTMYYFYVTEDGALKISNIKPYDRREDLQGRYHPYNSWRCVGSAFNDGSQNLESVNSYFTRNDAAYVSQSHTAAANIQIVERVIPVSGSGGAITQYVPAAALWRGSTLTFVRTDDTLANAVTLDFYGSEAILDVNSRTTYKMYSKGESVTLFSDGTNISIANSYIPSVSTTYTLAVTGVTSNPTKASSATIDSAKWKRRKDSIIITWIYSAPNNTGAADGSGTYLFSFPSNVTADGTAQLISTTPTSASPVAYGTWNNGTSREIPVEGFLYDSTHLAFRYLSASAYGSPGNMVGSANGMNTVAGWKMAFRAEFVVSGWEG